MAIIRLHHVQFGEFLFNNLASYAALTDFKISFTTKLSDKYIGLVHNS